MKASIRYVAGYSVVCLLLLLSHSKASAQNRIDATIGAGMPELVCLGAKMELQSFQIGADIGFFPFADNTGFTCNIDLYYHLLGNAKLSERKPWYVRVNSTYLRIAENKLTLNHIYLHHRFGREFNFTEKFGASADIGFAYRVMYIENNKSDDLFYGSDVFYPLQPSFGIHFFYKIN